MLDMLYEYPIQSDRSNFAIDPTLGRLGQRTQTVMQYVLPDGRVRAFDYRGNPGLVRLDPGWSQAALRFVRLGFDHILDGIDHLLFLACLVIPVRRVRPLIAVVTSFAVAHSVTLIASAYGFAPATLWFQPLIETLIAVSIVFMAVENAIGVSSKRRWQIVFAFGLVHGFGLAFALRETLQFGGGHTLAALIFFNVGIELGQLLAIRVRGRGHGIALQDRLCRARTRGNHRALGVCRQHRLELDARARQPALAVASLDPSGIGRDSRGRIVAMGAVARDRRDTALADVESVSPTRTGRKPMTLTLKLTTFALALVVAAPALAQDMVAKNVRIVVTAANPKDARVVGTISNPGMCSTYLVSATSDAAERGRVARRAQEGREGG